MTGSEPLDADPVVRLLLAGEATTADEAEELYLDRSADELIGLLRSSATADELNRHPLIRLLIARGSRPPEDSVL